MTRRRPMYMPDFRVERALRKQGFRMVAGLDEAGRGAWAGPLYAAAVILPLDGEAGPVIQRLHHEGVRDGKRISPNRREMLDEMVREAAIGYGIGWASSSEVDVEGVVVATKLAMQRSIEDLRRNPDYLLIDGRSLDLPEVPTPQESLSKGEHKARCIAAASILAKVARDQYMRALDAELPDYGFAQHKGYGTPGHHKALKKLGPCDEHRFSFRPIANLDGIGS